MVASTLLCPKVANSWSSVISVICLRPSSLVPRYAATTGMKPILAAKRELLLACFAEQQAPLTKMLGDRRPTPELPASYLLAHPDFTLIYTADKINLDAVL